MLLLKNTCCFIWYVRENFSKLNQGTDAVRQFKSKIRDMFIVGDTLEKMKNCGGQETVASLLQMSQPNISKRKRKTSVSLPRAVPKRSKRSDAFQDEIAIADIQSHWVSTHVLDLPHFV